MKTFLVVCEHVKETVRAESAIEARDLLPCKRCRVFDLANERWCYRDVRIYSEEKQIHAKTLPVVRRKIVEDTQIDWIGKP